MNFIRSVSLTLVIKFLNLGLSTLFTIILARYLGPQGVGFWALVMSISALTIQLTNFALDNFNIYSCAQSQENIKKAAPNSFWFAILIGILSSVLVFLLVKFFPQLIGTTPTVFLAVALVAVPFSLIYMFFQAILLGINKISVYNWFEFFNQFLPLIFSIIVLIFLKKGILDLLIARTVIIILLSVMMIAVTYKFQKFRFSPHWDALKTMLGYGLMSHPCRLLAFLVLKSDILLINYFLGPSSTGIYSVAVNFGDMLLILPGIIGLMLFPHLSADQTRESAVNTAKVARLTVIIMLFSCLATFLIYQPLVKIVFGAAFLPSMMPMFVLLPGVFFLSVEIIFAQYLAARVKLNALLYYWGAAFLVNLLLNLILLPKIGIVGASLSSSFCYLLVGIMIWRYFQKLTGISAGESFLFKAQDLKEIKLQLFGQKSASSKIPPAV